MKTALELLGYFSNAIIILLVVSSYFLTGWEEFYKQNGKKQSTRGGVKSIVREPTHVSLLLFLNIAASFLSANVLVFLFNVNFLPLFGMYFGGLTLLSYLADRMGGYCRYKSLLRKGVVDDRAYKAYSLREEQDRSPKK
jgi:hypothetical protein